MFNYLLTWSKIYVRGVILLLLKIRNYHHTSILIHNVPYFSLKIKQFWLQMLCSQIRMNIFNTYIQNYLYNTSLLT